MVCTSIHASCTSPEKEQVLSSGEAAEPLPLTPGQLIKLKALMLLCVGLFLAGVAATSDARISRGFLTAGAGVRLAVAPPGMNGR